jgi:hypothetical protein
MEKAKIRVINWTTLPWNEYTKLIKNISFNMAERISKEAFEKYSLIVIDANDGSIIFGKSRVTDLWAPLDNLKNYEQN